MGKCEVFTEDMAPHGMGKCEVFTEHMGWVSVKCLHRTWLHTGG